MLTSDTNQVDIYAVHILDSDPRALHEMKKRLSRKSIRIHTHTCFRSFLANHDPETSGAVIVDLDFRADDEGGATPHPMYCGGLAILRQLRTVSFRTPVLMTAADPCWTIVVQAMKLGCLNVIKKPIVPIQLLEAVTEALQRFQQARHHITKLQSIRDKMSRLSSSERDVLQLICEGYLNKQIAIKLKLSVRTIELRRANIFEKLSAKSLGEIIAMVVYEQSHPFFSGARGTFEPTL